MLPSASAPGLRLRFGNIGPIALEQLHHDRLLQCREGKSSTSGADGRQQPARAVADQQQQGSPRRLFEDLEQSVGGAAVHFLRTVDDDDTPAFLGGGETKEAGDLTRILNHDLAT